MTVTSGRTALTGSESLTTPTSTPLSVRDFVSDGSGLTAEHLALREAVRSFL